MTIQEAIEDVEHMLETQLLLRPHRDAVLCLLELAKRYRALEKEDSEFDAYQTIDNILKIVGR